MIFDMDFVHLTEPMLFNDTYEVAITPMMPSGTQSLRHPRTHNELTFLSVRGATPASNDQEISVAGFDTVTHNLVPIYNSANNVYPLYPRSSFAPDSWSNFFSFPVENQVQSVLYAGIPPYLGGEEPRPMDLPAQPPVTPVTSALQPNMATCTLSSSHGHGRECGAQLPGDYRSMASHLRTVHSIQDVKLAHPLIPCPDESCRCRFRGKACLIGNQQVEGTARHRTHVADLVRHCMDKHSRGANRASCEHCGQSFTRPESRKRHLKTGCPKVSLYGSSSFSYTD